MGAEPAGLCGPDDPLPAVGAGGSHTASGIPDRDAAGVGHALDRVCPKFQEEPVGPGEPETSMDDDARHARIECLICLGRTEPSGEPGRLLPDPDRAVSG